MPAGLDGNPDPFVTEARTKVLASVVSMVERRRLVGQPMLVAVDGIDGSGKSTFADELAVDLAANDVRVVRSTIDSFHNPRAHRMRRGATSPVGFYLDSHDLDSVRANLLDPFAAGSGAYVTAMFDAPSDQAVEMCWEDVNGDQVLIFDGIFCQRPELADYWDLTIFLDAQQRVDLRRLSLVLEDLPDDPTDVVAHVLEWNRKIERYASGMRYYLDLVDPGAVADVVIDNNDLRLPTILRSPPGP